MKIHLQIALFLVGGLSFACSKTQTSPAGFSSDNGCIQDITQPASAHALSASQVAAANSLFDRNRIGHANFRYFQYRRDSLTNFAAPTRVLSELVQVHEYVNGLKVFTAQQNFIFWNGIFHYRAGSLAGSTLLPNVPVLATPQVRGLFRDAMARFDSRNGIENQCVSAEFGYYNLAANKGGVATENVVRAWRVTKEGQEYPLAYFQDADGQLIYYDNGFRTFR